MKSYDVIIIGTGQATGTILGRLLELGRSVAIIESDRTGGSCVNWGCTPTKTLIASSRVAHVVHRAHEFGIGIVDQSTNFPKVMERVNQIRNSGSEGFSEWLEKSVDYYRGFGSFIDPHTIAIGSGQQIEGEQIIIHTGTRSRAIDVEGIEKVDWLDNKGILDLDSLPDHLMIIGGSYIALEFGQAFRRLGSRVTILESSPYLIPREDEEVSEIAREIIEEEGITCLTSASVKAVEKESEGQIKISVFHEEKDKSITGSHLLVAVGRIPNTDGLNLERAGVKTDKRGFIQVDDQCRTSVDHIFALGDVNGKGAFTHTSVHDGQVFLSMLNGGNRKISDRNTTYALYIDPPLARVGMTEKQVREAKIPYLVARKEMASVSRAREKDETQGMIKVLVDKRDDTLLGAAVFGVGGDEVIGMLALLMQGKLPYHVLQETVIPHPTVGELIPWVFDSLGEPSFEDE
jgi:pyruvate/2-oxoglutarate dehydrogenase complex dihydrolipoamide dehydrogenase (E3) component